MDKLFVLCQLEFKINDSQDKLNYKNKMNYKYEIILYQDK